MNDLTQNSPSRKELLKHMILQLHRGEAPDEVRKRLVELLKNIPYNEVVQDITELRKIKGEQRLLSYSGK